MPTKRPVTRIDRNGKPGRPAEVRNIARRTIADMMRSGLIAYELLPAAIPLSVTNAALSNIAADVLRALSETRDLHVVPGRIMRELALLAGEAAPPEPPAIPLPGRPEATSHDNT